MYGSSCFYNSSYQTDNFYTNMNSLSNETEIPEFRVRSHTWGGHDKNIKLKAEISNLGFQSPADSYNSFYESAQNSDISPLDHEKLFDSKQDLSKQKSKKSSRKNPWGQETYADLIEAAINAHPDQMATLQQIYEHISMNYQYFSERNDAVSSAGWKNSIRHNLSLHDKFVKCPKKNENMKSSLWSINHKCFKRARSNSMDNKKNSAFLAVKRKLKEQKRLFEMSNDILSESKSSLNPSEHAMQIDESLIDSVHDLDNSGIDHDSCYEGKLDIDTNHADYEPLRYTPQNYPEKPFLPVYKPETYYVSDDFLHQDLQKLEVKSERLNSSNKSVNILNNIKFPDFQTAALQYTKFVADIFINDLK